MLRPRRFSSICMLLFLGSTAGIASAQAPANPTFEVASIKPNKSGTNQRQVNWEPNGRFTAINVPLDDLIRFAYAEPGLDGLLGPLPPNRLSVAKTWDGGATALQSNKFDVIATTAAGASQEQVFLMLRALLKERFKLVVHRETRDLPIYVLVMARKDGRLGPRLRPSNVDCSAAPSNRPTPSPAAGGFVAEPCKGLRNVPGKTGNFDIDLDWTPDRPLPPLPADAPALPQVDANGAGLFTALQEQLGLKVESTKNSIAILVVDHAEDPTEN